MTDRPIIFSAPMVRALLDGRKTQTRRVLGNSGPGRGRSNIFSAQIGWSDSYVLDPGNANWRERDTPYAPGDRLWVREAFATDGWSVRYYATDDVHELRKKRSPIHMPRWASRLTLLVTEVRVQRLQEISAEDCAREGVIVPDHVLIRDGFMLSARSHFRDLWNSIYGPDAWDANPWVCAISFTVHRCNIDTMEEGTW